MTKTELQNKILELNMKLAAGDPDVSAKDIAEAAKEYREFLAKKEEQKYDPHFDANGKKLYQCKTCGEWGHNTRTCPKNEKKEEKRNTCKLCGNPGHNSRTCDANIENAEKRREILLRRAESAKIAAQNAELRANELEKMAKEIKESAETSGSPI